MPNGRSLFSLTLLGWATLLIVGGLVLFVGGQAPAEQGIGWALLGIGLILVALAGLLISTFAGTLLLIFQRLRGRAESRDAAPRIPRADSPPHPFIPPPPAPPFIFAPPPPMEPAVAPPAPAPPVEPPVTPPPATSPADSLGVPAVRDVAFERPRVDARVARDYDQRIPLTLRNTAARPIAIAARAAATYDELPADIVGRGSADAPVELAPGASLTLELAVTAVDAQRDDYDIPVEAGGASTVVRVRVDRPDLKLSFRALDRNPATLACAFEIRNDGETVGDLSVTLATPEQEEARLEPSAGHAYLPSGESLRFVAAPVLYLEFERCVAQVECRAAGQLRRFPIEFAAPPGRRLLGVRTGCGHHSHAYDWLCTNRPRIAVDLFGPECFGELYDDVLDGIRLGIDAAGLSPFFDVVLDPKYSPWIHAGLDGLGMLPIVGTPADAANAALYAIEGDWAGAGMSAIAMIPLLGEGATLAKYGVKLTREAAERLGKEGIEAAFRRGARKSLGADDVARGLPGPAPPRALPPRVSGAGLSRADNVRPRPSADGAGDGAPPSRGGGGGDPPGGGGGGPSGPPGGGRPEPPPGTSRKMNGQTYKDNCVKASLEYAEANHLPIPEAPKVFPIPRGQDPLRTTEPGVFDPLFGYRDAGIDAPFHVAVRNENGTIFDRTIFWNIRHYTSTIPPDILKFEGADTFEPEIYRILLDYLVDVSARGLVR